MTARRVVVTRLTRRQSAARRPRGPLAAEGEAPDVRELVARQLRQALTTTAAALALLAGLPAVTLWTRAPGALVALTLAVQPALVALAVRHLRRAERLER
ncbi:hypothetical protein [Nonomuraea sp. LPB2021202275-12-8]|uniref:hypothetical protein n=1 Tax=Nonomuraea sp. LPB2021202275-12-8 TaxID=3120159 RepID=UPI00300D1A78